MTDVTSRIGVEKKSSLEVSVPEVVFRAGRDFAYGFLRGLFSADGTITKEGYISLSSVSKALIKNTQLILLSLGIPSRISVINNRDKAYGKNPLYRLSIITQEGTEIFKKKIGFNGKCITIDATKIALESVGKNLPNTPMLGALIKSTNCIEMNAITDSIKKKFLKKLGEQKTQATIDGVQRAYDEVK